MSRDFCIGYLMGIIVGEGSFTGDKTPPSLAVKMHEHDPEPMLMLQQVFGGRINGPYEGGANRGRHIIWQLRGKELRKAIPIIEANLPLSRKRRQFETWRVKYGLNPNVASWNIAAVRK